MLMHSSHTQDVFFKQYSFQIFMPSVELDARLQVTRANKLSFMLPAATAECSAVFAFISLRANFFKTAWSSRHHGFSRHFHIATAITIATRFYLLSKR